MDIIIIISLNACLTICWQIAHFVLAVHVCNTFIKVCHGHWSNGEIRDTNIERVTN